VSAGCSNNQDAAQVSKFRCHCRERFSDAMAVTGVTAAAAAAAAAYCCTDPGRLMRTASLFVTAPACTNHCCLFQPIVHSPSIDRWQPGPGWTVLRTDTFAVFACSWIFLYLRHSVALHYCDH
jgi:hypothetical protein